MPATPTSAVMAGATAQSARLGGLSAPAPSARSQRTSLGVPTASCGRMGSLRGAAMSGRSGSALPPALASSWKGASSSGGGGSVSRAGRAARGALRVGATAATTTTVRFTVAWADWATSLKVVGEHPSLGNWDLGQAPSLERDPGTGEWKGEVEIESGASFQFKFVSGEDWEPCDNRHMTVPSGASEHGARFGWGSFDEPPPPAGPSIPGATPPPDAYLHTGDFLATKGAWSGGHINFVTSKDGFTDHRHGQWETDGLTGAALKLVEGDRNAKSWREKLEVVANLIQKGEEPLEDTAAMSAIYLTWIASGQIPCVESGEHYRPNHHALLAQDVFKALEKATSASGCPGEILVSSRRVHPKLPSFKEEFTCSVPLTRIRDIAHRNDIPRDVKLEIKHTIQNKLHRNAGPEDLVATEAMLERLVHGDFNHDFVNEFRIFHKELKEFFNASSLEERLQSLRGELGAGSELLDSFLWVKGELDNGGGGLDALIGCLGTLTTLRGALCDRAAAAAAAAGEGETVPMLQEWRLAEIGLEDYAFILLSRVVNELEASGLSSPHAWTSALRASALATLNVGLGGWADAECAQVGAELEDLAAKGDGLNLESDDGLKAKAALDRARRVGEEYSDCALRVFAGRAEELGAALGIDDYSVRVFAESEIRASVVFQLAKLCTLLLKSVRSISGAAAWDTLVPGSATGTLVEVDRIVPGALPGAGGDDIILIVKSADGDEEVTAAGKEVRGVMLQQELPHLSHLGVRARQEKVVFVTGEDADLWVNVRAMMGKRVTLAAGPDGVSVTEAGPAPAAAAPPPPPAPAAAAPPPPPAPAAAAPPPPPAATPAPAAAPAAAPAVAALADVPEAVMSAARASVKALMDAGLSAEQLSAIIAELSGGAPAAVAAAPAASGAPAVLELPPVTMSPAGTVLRLADATPELTGAKAAACAQLSSLAENGAGGVFRAPAGCCVPFGAMEAAIDAAGARADYDALIASIETAEVGPSLDDACSALQTLVRFCTPPPEVVAHIAAELPGDRRLIVRSSANIEDLAGMSAAGLYDSIPNVRVADPQALVAAIGEVWASLYSRRAVLSRRAAGAPEKGSHMAVLVQELLAPEVSFVLHTTNPADGDHDVLYAELAVGLGETLASGTRGTPWRLAVNKHTGEVNTLALANLSEALVVDESAATGLASVTVDYTTEPLSVDPAARDALGRRLSAVGILLEQTLGGAQDIEGCLVGDEIYVVQARPQP